MKKSKGFLLIEAIFSVFITLLVVLILQGMINNLRTFKKFNRPANEVSFAYVQLDRFLHEKNTKVYTEPARSRSYRAVFCKQKAGKKTFYIIKQYQDMVKVTTDVNGHMPLILNVKKSTFETKDDQIKINILEKDNTESELYFRLDSKKDGKDEKINSQKKTKEVKTEAEAHDFPKE